MINGQTLSTMFDFDFGKEICYFRPRSSQWASDKFSNFGTVFTPSQVQVHKEHAFVQVIKVN